MVQQANLTLELDKVEDQLLCQGDLGDYHWDKCLRVNLSIIAQVQTKAKG